MTTDKINVFTVLAEGGSIYIFRVQDENGERFLYNHNEFDASDSGMEYENRRGLTSFESAFQKLHQLYEWYFLYLETVHEDYIDYVLAELIDKLNKDGVKEDGLYYSKEQLEKALNVKLKYGALPLNNGLLDITIYYYQGVGTDYEYKVFSDYYYDENYDGDSLKLIGTNEDMKFSSVKCKGRLEFSGSTVIVKNENDQIIKVFSSQNARVTCKPVLGNKKGWYYEELKKES